MKRFKLSAEPRTITGKNVKKLRRDGILPANVYGKDIKSQNLQLPLKDFLAVFDEAGETGVIDLSYGKETIPVLIHNLHTDYRNTPLHADFFKVNLKEKVTAMIPVEFTGEAQAETDQVGLLEKITNELEVEALPTDLPEKFELNVGPLAQVGDQITVEMIHVPEGVTILSDPGLVVAKIGELVSKEAQEDAQAAEAAAEAAAAEGTEGAEGEGQAAEGGESADGEKPAEGENSEEKPQE
jgi:large subunit ribosomal protein L25